MKFRPLASSSAGCCYLLDGGGASKGLIIECGIPMRDILEGTGFLLSEYDGCLISHSHMDHCVSAKDLMANSVDCYASTETWKALPSKYWATPHRMETLSPMEESQIGDWQVLPFYAMHDAPGTLGFFIGAPNGERLLYLTDSMYSPHKFAGLTHIAIECNHDANIIRDRVDSGQTNSHLASRVMQTHMSIDTVIAMLKANDLSKVEEIHLLHLSDGNSDEAGFKKRVEDATGCRVKVAAK